MKLDKGKRWKIGHQFKKTACSYKSPNIDLDNEFKSLHRSLKEIRPEELNLGVIHGDLSSSNILKKKAK